MTGKRSMPQTWWARRETLQAAGGTALAVWLIVAAWMLFRPMGPDGSNFGPDQGPTQLQIVPTTPATTDGRYDPSPYTGKVNTPGFTPRPSPGATGGTSGATSGTSPTAGSSPTATPSTPAPSPTPTGHGHGNGHGHGKP